jgi:hypothetical protein
VSRPWQPPELVHVVMHALASGSQPKPLHEVRTAEGHVPLEQYAAEYAEQGMLIPRHPQFGAKH